MLQCSEPIFLQTKPGRFDRLLSGPARIIISESVLTCRKRAAPAYCTHASPPESRPPPARAPVRVTFVTQQYSFEAAGDKGLVYFTKKKIKNFFKISRHIESCSIYIKY